MERFIEMKYSQDLTGPCQHCGGPIAFPETDTGSTVICPHCGKETLLSTESEFAGSPPPSGSRAVAIFISFAVVGLALMATGALIIIKKNKHRAAGQTETVQTPAAPTNITSSTATQTVAAAASKPAKALSDLKVGEFKLEKTKGSSLVYVTGILKNDSDFQRFGVKIQFDLFNRNQTNVGTAQDYIGILEPRHDWQFRALVTDPRAVSAQVASIKEEE
jgi:predicted RNA-binding Zn-ribbon protein involved in translation (DUF1610 family)